MKVDLKEIQGFIGKPIKIDVWDSEGIWIESEVIGLCDVKD